MKTFFKKQILVSSRHLKANYQTSLTDYHVTPFLYSINASQSICSFIIENYYALKMLTPKLQQTAANIGFINELIHNKVIPKIEVKKESLNNKY